MTADLAARLGIEELRSRFLKYTTEAFNLLPSGRIGSILEIGCGRGTCLVHLAGLSEATLVGVDIDATALARAQAAIDTRGLTDRITVRPGSILDPALPRHAFDLIWEEGVLHIVDLATALAGCRDLLRPDGLLVSGETVLWHGDHHEAFARAGFEERNRIAWEPGCWWTDYYQPLQRRVEELTAALRPEEMAELRRYEDEIATVAGNPRAADCVHVIFRVTPRASSASAVRCNPPG